jgi:hypothetical protein
MEQGEIRFLIEGLLPEGINFIAALPGVGKSWFALSVCKALATGKPFLGRFRVPDPVPSIYMVPECGELSFRKRLDILAMPDENFFVRTLKDGPALKLNDPRLHDAVRELRPVIVLDSAIRFNDNADENNAAGNRVFADSIFKLVHAGARGVLANHHSTKASGRRGATMTLENMMRGTGDLAATADAVYGLRTLNQDTLHIEVECLKPRDFEKPASFEIQGRPYLNETGDFALLGATVVENAESESAILEKFLLSNQHASYRAIAEATKISAGRIKGIADGLGFWQEKDEDSNKTIWIAPAKGSLQDYLVELQESTARRAMERSEKCSEVVQGF